MLKKNKKNTYIIALSESIISYVFNIITYSRNNFRHINTKKKKIQDEFLQGDECSIEKHNSFSRTDSGRFNCDWNSNSARYSGNLLLPWPLLSALPDWRLLRTRLLYHRWGVQTMIILTTYKWTFSHSQHSRCHLPQVTPTRCIRLCKDISIV